MLERFADGASGPGSAAPAGQVSSPATIEALVRDYYSYVYHLAVSILEDPDEAEDAAQETFVAAYLTLERFRGESRFKTWLYAIAVNTCRSFLRRRMPWKTLTRAGRPQVPGPINPEQATLQTEAQARVWSAVDKLDQKHRLPVLLRYVHDLPISEISQVLGIPEGTVASRLHYARHKLQETLSRSMDESVRP